ncbi:filaggrin isoform X2 [Diachasma alloeum]|nr:filaggrin isoform X2 [Diachasma alloeum]
MMSDKVREKLERLTIPEPPKSLSEGGISSISSSIHCVVGEGQAVGDKMERGKTDCGVNTRKNVKSIQDYLENHSRMALERVRRESTGSDTLAAILNAERLVQEAKGVIAEARRRAISSKTVSEDFQIMRLTEEELEIKSLVSAKFDEANGRKLRTKLEVTLPPNPPRDPENFGTPSKPLSPRSKTPSARAPATPLNRAHSPPSIEIQRGPRIDIRNDLSLTKMSPLDIHPRSPPPRPNTGTFQLRHEASKRVTIDEPTSLIDAGVQTSLRDSSEISKFEERDALSRSGPSDLDQNKIDGSNEVHHTEPINDDFGRGKIDGEGLGVGAEIPNASANKNKPKRPGTNTFIDFLCGMNPSASQKEEKKTPGGCENSLSSPEVIKNSLSSSTISLKAPDTVKVESLLRRIDEKLKTIARTTETLDHLCSRSSENKSPGVAEGLIKGRSSEYEVEVLLEPRFRLSSSSSAVSTETLHPARFSTPLNNKIDRSIVKSRVDQCARAVVSSPAVSDSDNVGSNVIDEIIPMTRNELSYDKNDKVFRDKVSSSGESATSETDETGSLFPTYSTDKSGVCGDRRSGRSVRMNRGSCHEMKITNVERLGIDNEMNKALGGLPEDKDDGGRSEDFVEISGDVGNEEHQVHGSSGREGTSQDVSRLSSEIVGGSGDDGERTSRGLGGNEGGDGDDGCRGGRLRRSGEGSRRDLEEKSSSRSSIGHEGMPSALLRPSTSCGNSNGRRKESRGKKEGPQGDEGDGGHEEPSKISGEGPGKELGEKSSSRSSIGHEGMPSTLLRPSSICGSFDRRRKESRGEKGGPEGGGGDGDQGEASTICREGSGKDLGEKSASRSSISHEGMPSALLRHSSSCGNSDVRRKESRGEKEGPGRNLEEKSSSRSSIGHEGMPSTLLRPSSICGSFDRRRKESRGGKGGPQGDEGNGGHEEPSKISGEGPGKELGEKRSWRSSISRPSVLLRHSSSCGNFGRKRKESRGETEGPQGDGGDGDQGETSTISGEGSGKDLGEKSSSRSSSSHEGMPSALLRTLSSCGNFDRKRKESRDEKEGPQGHGGDSYQGELSKISGEGSGKDLEAKSSSNSISHEGMPSASSRHSSSCGSSDGTRKSSTADCYSEGELFISSSCGYSLGEVVGPSRSGGIVNKICVNLAEGRTLSMIQASAESPGELLDTDIDSNSSFTSRGRIA